MSKTCGMPPKHTGVPGPDELRHAHAREDFRRLLGQGSGDRRRGTQPELGHGADGHRERDFAGFEQEIQPVSGKAERADGLKERIRRRILPGVPAGHDLEQLHQVRRALPVVEPESDGLGRRPQERCCNLDASPRDIEFVGVRHGPHNVDHRQGVGDSCRGGDVVQTRKASAARSFNPVGLAGGAVVVAFPRAKDRLSAPVAAVQDERLSGRAQAVIHQGRRDANAAG